MDPILTVIIPVYNDEVNIIRCLESLINQTFKAMSIIVVNDASTDNTLTVLESYQKRHPFTIVNMEKNSGAAICRNIGIHAARTPYVTFIDSDDWIDISTYTNCFQQAQEYPDVFIFGLMYDHVMQNRRDLKYHYSKTYRMNGEFALSMHSIASHRFIPSVHLPATRLLSLKLKKSMELIGCTVFSATNSFGVVPKALKDNKGAKEPINGK